MQKVADASGSKYSGGGNVPSASAPKPPASSKPVFTPTAIAGSGSTFNPLGSRSRVAQPQGHTDDDGWGADAPPVTRTQLEKVAPAYKPTKVNIAELTSQRQEPSKFTQAQQSSDGAPDIVKGAYQPVGKVDIAEIRRQAKEAGELRDDRPTTVKGAYEPVGKVDIAAIRSKAQGPAASPPSTISPPAAGEDEEAPRSLAERSTAFQQSERLTSLPKPKVANKFGGSGTFTGTKAPTPSSFATKPAAAAPPVGLTSRTFADQDGKTPAQLWAEKKARERGSSMTSPGGTSPIQPQTSGGWSSGYTGKKWEPVQTTHTGRSSVGSQRTGQDEPLPEEPTSPVGGISAIRDRFSGRAPMGAPSTDEPPAMDFASKPNAGVRGVPIPGLPTRPSAEEHFELPTPPRRPQPEEEEEEQPDVRPSSPIRVAMPVSRSAVKEQPELKPAARNVPPEPKAQDEHLVTHAAGDGKRAIVQYDYKKAEDNEIELREGEYVHNIDMMDEDWWMGTNEQGETGFFPSSYVEVVGDDAGGATASQHRPVPEPEPVNASAGVGEGKTATAQYDYEAAEGNELSFPEGAKIVNVVSAPYFEQLAVRR